MKKVTIAGGQVLTYDTKDKSLCINGEKTFSFDEMRKMNDQGKGVNRIHKPIPLLFWADCKNGKSSNWTLLTS